MIVNDVTVRPLSGEDLSDVSCMEKAYFSHPWSYEDIQKSLNDPYTVFYVACTEKEIRGYIGLRFGMDTADILTICVAEKYRHCGIGGKLLTEAIQRVREWELDPLFLDVRESNLPARRLYESFGFTALTVRKNYYRDPVEDAVVMIKEIKS